MMAAEVFQSTLDNSNPVAEPAQLSMSVTADGSGSSHSVKGARRG
jgi:hypothetical protein